MRRKRKTVGPRRRVLKRFIEDEDDEEREEYIGQPNDKTEGK